MQFTFQSFQSCPSSYMVLNCFMVIFTPDKSQFSASVGAALGGTQSLGLSDMSDPNSGSVIKVTSCQWCYWSILVLKGSWRKTHADGPVFPSSWLDNMVERRKRIYLSTSPSLSIGTSKTMVIFLSCCLAVVGKTIILIWFCSGEKNEKSITISRQLLVMNILNMLPSCLCFIMSFLENMILCF